MKNLKSNLVFGTIIISVGIISKILQSVSMFQSNGMLPSGTFNYVFYISIIFLVVWIVIKLLKNKFRPLYIKEQIKSFKNAEKYIYVSMFSLSPESRDSKIVEFDEVLEQAKNKGVTVKLLTPTGYERERSRGAYDVCIQRRLNIKFLDTLNDKDLRFSLIDNDKIIISCTKTFSAKFSSEYVSINSERLSKILRTYFDDMWDNKDALNFDQFLIDRLNKIGVMSGDVSIKKASELLDIPESFLKDFVDKVKNESFPR